MPKSRIIESSSDDDSCEDLKTREVVQDKSNTRSNEYQENESSENENDAVNGKKLLTENKSQSSGSSDSEDDTPLSAVKESKIRGKDKQNTEAKEDKNDDENIDSNSSSSSDNDSEPIKNTKETTPNKSLKKSSKTKQHENTRKVESSKLVKLKKYLSLSGIRVRCYDTVFEGCKSMKAKERKLLSLLEENGIDGQPTISKCKRLKLKRDQENEIAELDLGNILPSPDKGRRKRHTRKSYTNNNKDNTNQDDMKEHVMTNNWKNKLSDLLDSESDGEQPPKKRVLVYDSEE